MTRKEELQFEIPRRNRLDKNTPAELKIFEAVQAVEEAGAHPLLTEAVELLKQAKEKVGDFVDQESEGIGEMSIEKISKEAERQAIERIASGVRRRTEEKSVAEQLAAIKQRLAKITDPATNTDEKLENGAITDSVMYSEDDIAWLLGYVADLSAQLAAKEQTIADKSAWIDRAAAEAGRQMGEERQKAARDYETLRERFDLSIQEGLAHKARAAELEAENGRLKAILGKTLPIIKEEADRRDYAPIEDGDGIAGYSSEMRILDNEITAALATAAPVKEGQTVEEKIAVLEREFGVDIVRDIIEQKIKVTRLETSTVGALWVRSGMCTSEELEEMRRLGVSLDEYRKTHPTATPGTGGGE